MKPKDIAAPLVLFFAISPIGRPADAASSSLRDQMIAKAKEEGQVVFVGNLADQLKTLLKGFTKKYPFIQMRGVDSRAEEAINRVATEARAGRLSIDVSGMSLEDVGPLLRLNLLAKNEFSHLKDFPGGLQPSHGLYTIGQVEPLPHAVYNTNLVPPGEVPTSWQELLLPKWKGKTVVSRSRNEVPAKLAWLWRRGDELNWGQSLEFFKKLKQLEPTLGGPGIATHVSRLAAGEFLMMWFPASGSVLRLQLKGAPVALVAFPKLMIRYDIWVIFKNAPHSAAAWLLVDYLLSPEGQFEYTDVVDAVLPMNQKAKPGKLAQLLIKQGMTLEKSDLVEPDKFLAIFTDEVLKKAQTSYFNIMGYR